MCNVFQLLKDYLSASIMGWSEFKSYFDHFSSYFSIQLLSKMELRPEYCKSDTDNKSYFCGFYSSQRLIDNKNEFITVILLFNFKLQNMIFALAHTAEMISHSYIEGVSEIVRDNNFFNGIPRTKGYFDGEKPFSLNNVPSHGLVFCKKINRNSALTEVEFVENMRDFVYIYNRVLQDDNSV